MGSYYVEADGSARLQPLLRGQSVCPLQELLFLVKELSHSSLHQEYNSINFCYRGHNNMYSLVELRLQHVFLVNMDFALVLMGIHVE